MIEEKLKYIARVCHENDVKEVILPSNWRYRDEFNKWVDENYMNGTQIPDLTFSDLKRTGNIPGYMSYRIFGIKITFSA